MRNESTPSILFVCLGNICRSPMAEGALRARARRAGIEIRIDSAGTGDWHVGRPPDPRACKVALAHGVDIGGLRARRVEPADFRHFQRVFALDRHNLADLQELAPKGATARLALLQDVVRGHEGEDVADPYYGGPAEFEAAWAEIDRAAAAIMALLRRAPEAGRPG